MSAIDIIWIIACIRQPSLRDSVSQPYVDDFFADPIAWASASRNGTPEESGAIDSLLADYNDGVIANP